jgi:endonuclease/exonuclease/phosphatase family metal-dependent hydrolase
MTALIAIGSCAAGVSAQTTVTLSAPGSHIPADLTVRDGAYGLIELSKNKLVSKAASESYNRRILLSFDTENFIPANAVIRSARLDLVLKTADSSEERPLTAYHVTNAFVEGETNWYYFRNGEPWSTPGGDLGEELGTTYVGDAVGSAFTFDVAEIVQRAVNGEFGSRHTRVALVDTGEPSPDSYRAFHSTGARDEEMRPRLVITYDTTPAPAPEPPPAPAETTIRVMQWNVHKTEGSDGRCDPDRVANTIVAQNVDVVSLNEVKFFSGVCAWSFDMGERLQSLIQQKTGITWYKQDVNVYGGTSGAGNVLLSRYRPASSSSTLLSHDRGVAQIGIVVDGVTVNLFSTHVEYFNSSWRPIQIAEAVRWMSNFSEPRIVMGDFNTVPRTSDYSIIAGEYQDAWVVAERAGTATAYRGTGATHGASRFDYVFHSNTAALSLRSAEVPDTRVDGVYPSDHDPVVAVFSIR